MWVPGEEAQASLPMYLLKMNEDQARSGNSILSVAGADFKFHLKRILPESHECRFGIDCGKEEAFSDCT